MDEVNALFRDLHDLFLALRSGDRHHIRRVVTRLMESGWEIDDALFNHLVLKESFDGRDEKAD